MECSACGAAIDRAPDTTKAEKALCASCDAKKIVALPLRDEMRARCPFCHSEISVESDDWVACKSCLARHHRECWLEASACSVCQRADYVSGRRSRRLVWI